MALFAGVILAGIPRVVPFEIRNAARVLAADLQYASQRSIATGELSAFVVDLDAQTFRLEHEQETAPAPGGSRAAPGSPVSHAELLDLRAPGAAREFVPLESRAGEWRWLDEDEIEIERVIVGADRHDSGLARVLFGADGSADPAELELVDPQGRRMRVLVSGFTGEVRILEEPGD
jgi:hypothetical protein